MPKNKKIIYGILAVIVIAGSGLAIITIKNNRLLNENCDEFKQYLKKLIDETNYCDEDSDCAVSMPEFLTKTGLKCYFLHNKKSNMSGIQSSAGEFIQKCQPCKNQICPSYPCEYESTSAPQNKDIKCLNGKCVDTRFGNSQQSLSPEDLMEQYREALKNGDQEKYLNCMTEESKNLVYASRSLMQNEYQGLKNVSFLITFESARSAVINYDPPSSKVPPYFLKKENGQWKLDIKRIRETYIFDQNNNWLYR